MMKNGYLIIVSEMRRITVVTLKKRKESDEYLQEENEENEQIGKILNHHHIERIE